MYRPVPPQVDLAALDHEVLALWRERDVFGRSLAATEGRPLWVFNEGPPTANGMPGTHHVEARVFKDVFPRYRTMKGYHVPRKAGWDCHGLPVELAVEKELGFSGKKDIEDYGIAAFNAKCRESVLRHVGAFADLTERMGYWVDMGDAYWTMDPQYVESVWWSLKQIFDKGLLVQDHRVTPYCPRCGTGLSDHELAQGYETVVDPSVYIRMPVTGGDLVARHPGLALLVWTTTPWTLVSNTACAVNPDVDYVVTRTADGETLLVAEALRVAVLGEDSTVLETVRGESLVGTPYSRPFTLVEFPATDAPVHTVLAADFVTTEDGSGIVHEAPAFGAEDLALCRSYGLPVVNPLRPDGTFEPEVGLVGGLFFKKADDRLVPDLMRAAAQGQVVPIRNPNATRPWQHVLEPLAAYLHLAHRLWVDPVAHAGAWNFGPDADGHLSVGDMVDRFADVWPAVRVEADTQPQPHEACLLHLDCSHAHQHLQWRPVWGTDAMVQAVSNKPMTACMPFVGLEQRAGAKVCLDMAGLCVMCIRRTCSAPGWRAAAGCVAP